MKSLLKHASLPRLRQALTIAPFFMLACSGLVGLRAFLAGEPAVQVVHAMLDSLGITALISLIVGSLHVFGGDESVSAATTQPVSWPTVLVSAYLGFLSGAGLYFFAGVSFLASVGLGASPFPAAVWQLSLLGGLDGFFWGGSIGLTINMLNPRATHLTRDGVELYLVLYVILGALLSVGVLLAVYLKVSTGCLYGILYFFLIFLRPLSLINKRENRV